MNSYSGRTILDFRLSARFQAIEKSEIQFFTMGQIQLLSEEVASQVAAGEVVERPASVVKELVENSLDAGARRIEVLIRRGGISQIKVVDDGAGMDRDDALLCLERHATSKIRTGNDLASIATLGFRGEALPSIASVSRFRLSTRPHGQAEGTEILVSGGKIDAVRAGGDAPGTQIEVRSLFYNLPARRKFLRTENTEASHVEHHLHLQAIGHPGVAFVFIKDDRTALQLPAAMRLADRIRDLSGAELVEQLVEIEPIEEAGLRVSGFFGKPGVSRSTRAQQIVFVNGRAIENPTVNYGLREGYHTALMKGQHPVTFLFLEMDPAVVDVNVHPAKREVRFRDPSLVREVIASVIRKTLETTRQSWTRQFAAPVHSGPAPPISQAPVTPFFAVPTTPALRAFPTPEDTRADVAPAPDFRMGPQTPPPPDATVPDLASEIAASAPEGNGPIASLPSVRNPEASNFKILGVLGKLYVLMENANGLVLVDQHAAHERILFEQLRSRMETRGVASQRLLMPLTLAVAPRDSDWLTRNLDTLQRMGIGIEEFGPSTWKIDALPSFIKTSDPLQLVRHLIDDLRSVTAQTSKLRLGEDVIAKTVCRHAVKANDTLRREELVQLIRDLLACELPYCCPHGRPTMIQMSYGELEKKFGRKV
ncbi:MAG TPA: DNA mismatch repair endonuclease MutL [Chthoniobacterales bacterium]